MFDARSNRRRARGGALCLQRRVRPSSRTKCSGTNFALESDRRTWGGARRLDL